MTALRVVLFDDDRLKARTVERMLRAVVALSGLGVHVTYLPNALGLMAIKADDYDAAITDWQMPGGGASVVRWAGEHGLPVVVISGEERAPASWTDTRDRLWPRSWDKGLRWLVARGAPGGVSLEVCG